MLTARAVVARVWLVILNVLAVVGAVLALLPILLGSGPAGRRIRLRPRVARVIPLGDRRRAAPPA